MYLPSNASRARRAEAERARSARAEIVAALSSGAITRRDLVKWGIATAAGALVWKRGLSPFAPSAYGDVPTGTPRSPVPSALAFTQPLPRLEVLPRLPVSALVPAPTERANTTPNVAKGIGPVEGRPPGPDWAHQRFQEFFPQVAYDVTTRPAAAGTRFHPALPEQRPEKVWLFNGTLPPKLVRARVGEPILFRHHNGLPADAGVNGGFGRNELSTHLHNGHNPAESDGFTGAFFFSQEFYDYRRPRRWAARTCGGSTPTAPSPSSSSSGSSPGCSWSTATTPRTRTTPCSCAGRSTRGRRRSRPRSRRRPG
jgi:manganese oxidase